MRIGRSKPIQLATQLVDVQIALNSALTVLRSACDWKDVDNASKAIKQASDVVLAVAEKVAEL